MILLWINRQLVAEVGIDFSNTVERGANIVHGALAGFSRNQAAIDDEGAFAGHDVVRYPGTDGVDADDGIAHGRMVLLQVLFKCQDCFGSFGDGVNASDPGGGRVRSAAQTFHLDTQESALSVANLKVAFFTD